MNIKQLSPDVSETQFKQQIFFALSDPGRYKIVQMLYDVGHEMGCGKLNQHVEIDKSTCHTICERSGKQGLQRQGLKDERSM